MRPQQRLAGTLNPKGPSTPPSASPARGRAGAALGDWGPVGVVFPLLLLWQFFEVGRPPTPAGLPLVLSAVLFFDWLFKQDRQTGRQTMWWIVFLGATGIGIVAAPNTYAAALTTRSMATLFLGACLPLVALVTTPKRLRWWVYGFLVVAFYAVGWAAAHRGMGPSGTFGGQDENYMAAMAGMTLPFAYFSLFLEKRMLPRIVLGFLMVLCLAAIGTAANPSRGGFLGLCAVALYCLARSPRKWLGGAVLGLSGAALVALAGPTFWAEIKTTNDFESGTADVRIEIWKAGLRMWEANPFFGVGAGNFRWVIADYQTPEQFEKFGRSLGGSIIAHSLPVELAAELGLAGLIATAALVWVTWRGLGKVRNAIPARSQNPDLAQVRCYADAIRCAILAVLVNGVFLSLLYYPHLWLLLAVGSAVPFVHRRILANGGASVSESGPRGVQWRPSVLRGRGPPPHQIPT